MLTPTPSEAVEVIILLVLAPALNELCTTTHSISVGGVLVLLALILGQLSASSSLVGAVDSTLPAVAVEGSPFAIIHMHEVLGVSILGNIELLPVPVSCSRDCGCSGIGIQRLLILQAHLAHLL